MEVVQEVQPMDNLTIKQLLEQELGPQSIPLEVVAPITVVYVLIFVSGVIGNVAVCLVIARNSHFHTPTNYYLFSLAISDLLILIFGLPHDLKVYWQQYPWVFGETFCRMRSLISETTNYASVLTIVAFSAERYIAIYHPLFLQTISSLSRSIKIITAVWVVALLSAIPFAVFTKVNYIEHPVNSGNMIQESAFCSLPLKNNNVSLPLVQFATLAFFFLPMTLIVILYVKIGLKLRNSRFSKFSRMASNDSTDARQQVARRSIHKMLVAVVTAFFLCWAPFHAQRLLAVSVDSNSWTLQLRTLNEVLYYLGGCLYYFSATINPILYSLMSTKYREAFRETLCTFAGKKQDSENFPVRIQRHQSEYINSYHDRRSSFEKPNRPGNVPLRKTSSLTPYEVRSTNRSSSPDINPPTVSQLKTPVALETRQPSSEKGGTKKLASFLHAVLGLKPKWSSASQSSKEMVPFKDNSQEPVLPSIVVNLCVKNPVKNGVIRTSKSWSSSEENPLNINTNKISVCDETIV